MANRSFFRHALLYGLSSVLMQAGGVVLVPLYTRCLTQADFGALEVLGRCRGTGRDAAAHRRAAAGAADLLSAEQDRRGTRTACSARPWPCCGGLRLLGGGLVMALAGPVCGCFQAHGRPTVGADLLRLAVLGILLEPLTLMPLALLQARLESAAFVAVMVSQFVVRVVLCVRVDRLVPLGRGRHFDGRGRDQRARTASA